MLRTKIIYEVRNGVLNQNNDDGDGGDGGYLLLEGSLGNTRERLVVEDYNRRVNVWTTTSGTDEDQPKRKYGIIDLNYQGRKADALKNESEKMEG